MFQSESPVKPEYILEIVSKRRWFIIVPFCLSMIAGIYFAFKLPKIYEASTLILVQPQRIPTNYVRSVVSIDIDARISTLSQQIMSRTNLEKIINEYNLFSDPKYENLYLEDKIEYLRKRINVKVTKAKKGADAFSISFKGKEPEKVMKIANTLATYFIDENLKLRETQAIGTSDFLDDELGAMRRRLEELEKALKEYRERYMGALPEQLETNLRILDRLQEQLSEKQEGLREAKSSLIAIENQITEMQRLQDNVSVFSDENRLESEADDLSKLNRLKKKLSDLKTKYTDQHPDILLTKKKIADLETKIEAQTEDNVEPETLKKETRLFPYNYTGLEKQRKEIKREILSLKADIPKLLDQLKIYQKRVEDTPKREQELLSLKRDYQNIRDSYNSLLERKLEAEIAVNMEKKQKGEQFRILDPARLPGKPLDPNMKKLFLLTVAGGLGIGAGLIFLLEYFNKSFRKPEEIEPFLGLSVLATVPVIYCAKDKRRQMVNQVVSIFFILISITLFAGFSMLTLTGVDQTMEFVRQYINL